MRTLCQVGIGSITGIAAQHGAGLGGLAVVLILTETDGIPPDDRTSQQSDKRGDRENRNSAVLVSRVRLRYGALNRSEYRETTTSGMCGPTALGTCTPRSASHFALSGMMNLCSRTSTTANATAVPNRSATLPAVSAARRVTT